jgi:putative membrane protein
VAEISLVALAGLYGIGLRRAWRRAGRGRLVSVHQACWFGLGILALVIALLPPLDNAAVTSLTAHMIQHVILLVVAAPLLVMGAPLPTLLWALPDNARSSGMESWRRVLRSRSGQGWAIWAGATIGLQTLVMWGWHAPVLYRAALRDPQLHALEHFSFVTAAAAFWWAVGAGSGRRHGGAVPAVFAAAFPGTVLGAALTLSTHPWYAEYSSLADQQMAGVVMWAFGGLLYVLAAAALFGAWLAAAERRTPGRPAIVVPLEQPS